MADANLFDGLVFDQKRCSKCRKTKPKSEFYRPKGSRYYSSYCKPCHKESTYKNIRKLRADPVLWAKYRAHRRRLERRKDLKTYGLTPEDYDRMFEQQGGLCAICQKPEKQMYRGAPRRLSVDHNHCTGKVRSLLCANCNVLVGYSNEDLSLLAAVVEYLKRHET